MAMKHDVVRGFVRIAAKHGDEFDIDEINGMPESLRDVVKAKMEEAKAKEVEDLAVHIVSLCKDKDVEMMAMVDRLRALRQQEAACIAGMKLLDNAARFGHATVNYIPLMYLLGNMGNITGAEYQAASAEMAKWLAENPESNGAEKPKKRSRSANA